MGMMEQIEQLSTPAVREYLTFRLGDEEYGIDILKVQEIRGYEAPTRIAQAPAFIKGVTNLRGTIVPIVDLRLKLGCELAQYTASTVVVVLNLRSRIVGIVVDSVSDVMALPQDSLRPAPEVEGAIDRDAVLGLGALGERMLILLDIEKLMSGMDMALSSEMDCPHEMQFHQCQRASERICLDSRDFERIQSLIYQRAGINLHDGVMRWFTAACRTLRGDRPCEFPRLPRLAAKPRRP